MRKLSLKIGSRASKRALVQTNLMKAALEKARPELDIRIQTIKTTGDKIIDTPLNKIGGKGRFTKEIEDALLKGEIDLAVHSMKDLPTELPAGLKIAAVTKREDARDVLLSGKNYTIESLPTGSRIGTSSLRRKAQILNKRRDLKTLDLRGNLDTRIRKLNEGLFDAIVVACAGIKRLGLKLDTSIISINDILPQAGQGALGIEIRNNDPATEEIIRILDDNETHLCIDAERALLSGLGGGCQVPIGVYAVMEGGSIRIEAGVFSLDGKTAIKDEISGGKNDAASLGAKLAERLLGKGAGKILNAAVGSRLW